MQETITQLQGALTHAQIERDVAREREQAGPTGGHNGALPYTDKFTSDEKSTSKRAGQFRTWRSHITGRWIALPTI